MRRHVLAMALAVSAWVLFAPRTARAETGATLVAIVTPDPASALTRRVRAELAALGVDVIVIRPPEGSATLRTPLEQAARNVGAAAAVRLVPSTEGTVEVWVADRVTGKAVVRELPASGTGASDAAVAVGTVELLRASLMELHSGEAPRGEVAPTPQIVALALPVSIPWVPRLGLEIGAGVDLGIRGLGPSVDGSVAVWIRIGSRLGVRVLGHTNLSAAESTTSLGSISLRSQMAGVLLGYSLRDPTETWVPSASIGIAAAHVATTGTATLPFEGTSVGAWYAEPLVEVGIAYAFARGLRVRADGLASWAFPSAEIKTPAGTTGYWGAPGLTGSVGFEVLWGP